MHIKKYTKPPNQVMVKMVFKNRLFFLKKFINLHNEKYFKSFHRSVTSFKISQGIQMNNNKKIFKHVG